MSDPPRHLWRVDLHKTQVWKSDGYWYAVCLTCPKALQQIGSNWLSHSSWDAAMDTALRHNSSNKWSRT